MSDLSLVIYFFNGPDVILWFGRERGRLLMNSNALDRAVTFFLEGKLMSIGDISFSIDSFQLIWAHVSILIWIANSCKESLIFQKK